MSGFRDTPQQAQWLVQRGVRQGPAAAAAAAASGGGSAAAAAAGPPGVNSLAPVNAMLSRGNALFSAGGKWMYNITLWNCLTYEPVEVHTVKSFGPTFSFAVMPWDGPSSVIAAGVPAPPGPFQAGSGMALGFAPAKATVPASVAAASGYGSGAGAAGAAAGAARAAAEAAEFNKWRLLTGHQTGQVSAQGFVLLLYCQWGFVLQLRGAALLWWWWCACCPAAMMVASAKVLIG